MRALAAAALLLLASCSDPLGQCKADADCLPDQVCGGDGLCTPGTRPPPGDAPVAVPDPYAFSGSGPFDVSATSGVLANDTVAGGAALTAVLETNAAWGQVYLAPDGSFTYAPILGFTGADAFTYRATTGVVSSDVTTVSLTVGP